MDIIEAIVLTLGSSLVQFPAVSQWTVQLVIPTRLRMNTDELWPAVTGVCLGL